MITRGTNSHIICSSGTVVDNEPNSMSQEKGIVNIKNQYRDFQSREAQQRPVNTKGIAKKMKFPV
jgi:hypothetical protein